METWTIGTDDGAGHLELHTFVPPGDAAGRAGHDAPAGEAMAAGSGVVIVHGTLVTDALYRPFARKLSRLMGRPVHCYNRRGRAGSSGQPAGYAAATEVSDLSAVLRETGASDVVAHSYGGFVALQAARTARIRRMVTYDAAVSLAGNLNGRWRPELEDSVAAGALDEAWAHLVQGLETAGPVSRLPLRTLRMLSVLSARTSLGAEMRDLLPTAVAEMRAVLEADADVGDFASVTTPTLMLSGGWSPSYFADTGRALSAAVPCIEFAPVPGQLHAGPIRPGMQIALTASRFLLGGRHPSRPPRGHRRRFTLGR